MKISTLQENLKQGLQTAGHLSSKNINLPILSNVLLEAQEGNIKLISTNLELGVVANIRGKIDAEGRYTVDAKIINDYINLLPNKKIEIELENDALKIECDNYKTKIKGQPADEYPLIPIVDKSEFYTVNKVDFIKSLSQVVFAVSNNETRLELSGVLFVFEKNSLILAATDSYRLAEKEIMVRKSNETVELIENKKIIIPSRTIQEVIRIFSNITEETGEDIKIFISDNQVLFADNFTELVSRLIEGQFPDYKQIIPKNHKTNAIINRQELVRAVKASSLFAKTGINDINLDFPQEENKTIVSSASGQTGESVISLSSVVKGNDNGVTVNYRYLLDGLNNINTENVKIEIIDNNTPCILRPSSLAKATEDKGKENSYLYIIMPIKQ